MTQQHTHKYQKKNIAKKGNTPYYVMACSLPNCSHNLSLELAIGKETICHKCGRKTVIWKDKNGIRTKPYCKRGTGCNKKLTSIHEEGNETVSSTKSDIFMPPLSIKD